SWGQQPSHQPLQPSRGRKLGSEQDRLGGNPDPAAPDWISQLSLSPQYGTAATGASGQADAHSHHRGRLWHDAEHDVRASLIFPMGRGYLRRHDRPAPLVQFCAYPSGYPLFFPPFHGRSLARFKTRSLTMDVPVALALWLAFLASVWITIFGGPEVYYESVCMFAFLLLLSRYIERKVRLKGTQSSSFLMSSMPAAAPRITNGEEEVVALADLRPGDLVRVKPGETIPADGYIREGRTSVNEAALTGEYLPVSKEPGSKIIGGTVNIESPLIAEITAVGENTQMSAIMRIMERAGRERPRIAVMANRVARYFISATLLVSVLVGWYWWHQEGPHEAFRVILSILVVTCPCALSLATPTALTAATTALRQRGFLI